MNKINKIISVFIFLISIQILNVFSQELKQRKLNYFSMPIVSYESFDANNGNIIQVPQDYSTIQSAINAASDNDTILVAQGIYYENISFLGKNISIISLSGPEDTIIDGGNPSSPDSASVVRFSSGESNAYLEGFSLRNGKGTLHYVYDYGTENTGGGVIARNYSHAAIKNCNILQNTAYFGGGISCQDHASLILYQCKISKNTISSSGGGFSINNNSYIELHRCLVDENNANFGAGIALFNHSSVTIERCTFTKNNSVLTGTTCGNGLYIAGGKAVIYNSIFWENSIDNTMEVSIAGSTDLTISHSDIRGGLNEIGLGQGASSPTWLTGNINIDPLFNNSSHRDYTLSKQSPCIDAGTDTVFDVMNNYFIIDDFYGSEPDMGAFETIPYDTISTPPIFPFIESLNQTAGDEFWVDINVGTESEPVTDLFGVSFVLHYNDTYAEIVPPYSSNVIPGDFLGSSDQLLFYSPDFSADSINVGITRKRGNTNLSGYGTVARIKFRTSPDTPDSTIIPFTLTSITANDSDLNQIQLTPQDLQIMILQPVSVTLQIEPDSQSVFAGDSAMYQVRLSTDGQFNSKIGLSIAGLASGMNAFFIPDSIDTNTLSSLSIQIDESVNPGVYYLTVIGSGGGLVDSVQIVLKVDQKINAPIFPYTFPNEKIAGDSFWIDIFVGTEQQPVRSLFGVSFKLNYTNTEYIDVVADDSIKAGNFLGNDLLFYSHPDDDIGRVSIAITRKLGATGVTGFGSVARIKFTSDPGTPHRTPIHFTLTSVTANDSVGNSIELVPIDTTIWIIQPVSDFTMNIEPDTQYVFQGESVDFDVSFYPLGTFNSPINLAISNLKSGIEAKYPRQPFNIPDSFSVTFITNNETVPGIYHPIFTASGGSISHSDTVTIFVKGFTLYVSPESQAISPGALANFSIWIDSIGSFSETVCLSLAGLELYDWIEEINLQPDCIEISETSELTIKTTDTAVPGTYQFSIIGSSSSLAATAIARLIIEQPEYGVRPNFITPNNDGHNDYIDFYFRETLEGKATILIFDVHGRKIKEINNDRYWYGKDENNKIVKQGAYLYVVKVKDKVIAKGIIGLAL